MIVQLHQTRPSCFEFKSLAHRFGEARSFAVPRAELGLYVVDVRASSFGKTHQTCRLHQRSLEPCLEVNQVFFARNNTGNWLLSYGSTSP